MTTKLDEILAMKRARVSEAKLGVELPVIVESAHRVRAQSSPYRFSSAFENRARLNVIAEFKRASPSKGAISDSRDAVETARAYENGGACAISVLTEEDFFQGSLDDLRSVRRAVSIPILRKDFVFDEFQIYEAAEAGADAILLIVAALDEERLRRLSHVAHDELRMDVLVEVHTRDEMEIAKTIGATLIGVNNRDLRSFEVSLDVSRGLIGDTPAGATLISESGLQERSQLIELRNLGYSGFLIGEALMRSDDPEGELKKLVAGDVNSSDPSTASTFV